MYKHILAFFLIIMVSFCVSAQETETILDRVSNTPDEKFLFTNEASGGVYIHSAIGIGVSARRGYHVNAKLRRLLEADISNFRHVKAIRISSGLSNGIGKSYILGRLHSIMLARVGYGYKWTVYKKTEKKNVEINCVGFVGGTVAFGKPNYLEVLSFDQQGNIVLNTERYNPELHNENNIYGRSTFFKGMSELKVRPGGYVKLGLNFDFIESYNKIKALEGGVIMDVYPVPIQAMAFTPNRNVRLSLYLKMNWGARWY